MNLYCVCVCIIYILLSSYVFTRDLIVVDFRNRLDFPENFSLALRQTSVSFYY